MNALLVSLLLAYLSVYTQNQTLFDNELDGGLNSRLDSELERKPNSDHLFRREILHQSDQHNEKYHKKRILLESTLIFCPNKGLNQRIPEKEDDEIA